MKDQLILQGAKDVLMDLMLNKRFSIKECILICKLAATVLEMELQHDGKKAL